MSQEKKSMNGKIARIQRHLRWVPLGQTMVNEKKKMPEETLNVRQRILAIEAACGPVGKNSKAPAAAGGYAFIGIDDVIEHLRPHLIEHGVVVVPSVVESSSEIREGRNGKPTFIERQTVEVAFQNADQPEDAFSVQVVGMAIGPSDKNPGIAYSYALKTALLAVFNLRGQPDADTGNGKVQPAASQQAAAHGQSQRPAQPSRAPQAQGEGGGPASPGQINILTVLRNDPRATKILHKEVTINGHLLPLIKEGCTFEEASNTIQWVNKQFKDHDAQQKGEAA